ncbi:hypothetical protein HAX54_018879 [Datura stramonium]|uniref:CCHC-type domain-containing protein n=1 Tax=Datura stramonium TaxID=4076 RepID=A0ABS8RJX9_DATST|nr:hypothetical protein [Datura stramonium]
MSSRQDSDIDDDFSELYKEYTGPTRKKRDATPDPNASASFTSREAKVWEAKSKATERNWKKRKEEEMICKICGESGHFTQGCPSTLGASRKSQDFFERVPARESHVKALFTEKVINQIEKDVGCKIKMEEKFIIVSGKDRLILRKGVDAVHKNPQSASQLLHRYGRQEKVVDDRGHDDFHRIARGSSQASGILFSILLEF